MLEPSNRIFRVVVILDVSLLLLSAYLEIWGFVAVFSYPFIAFTLASIASKYASWRARNAKEGGT